MIVHVQRARSLPVQFTQLPGDKEAMVEAFEAQHRADAGTTVVTDRLLRILFHHWDSISAANFDPSSIAEDEDGGDGTRVWATKVGMPLVRSLVETAAGFEVTKEDHNRWKPYYSTMSKGMLYGVCPAVGEQLLSFGAYKKAVKEAAGGSESSSMAIARGIRTFLRTDSAGNIKAPTADDCVTAGAALTYKELEALAQVCCAILTDNDLAKARKELQKDAIRAANEASHVVRESAPIAE